MVTEERFNDMIHIYQILKIDGNFNEVYTHRSITDNRYKSQQIPGKHYNFVINNNRVYNKEEQVERNYIIKK